MKKELLLIILLNFGLGHVTFGQTKNFIDMPYLETSANVDTLVIPDRIYLNILITEKDTKDKISVEELETKMERALKNLGVNTKKDLVLNDLSSNFKRYFLKQQDVLKAKSYTLKVSDAVTAGKVIVALEKIEVSNVSIDRTEFSEIEKLKLELKSRAVAKAKRQADYMVSVLNQQIGPAIHVVDHNNAIYNGFRKESALSIRSNSFKTDEYRPADIEFEKIKVESSVSVKFRLE